MVLGETLSKSGDKEESSSLPELGLETVYRLESTLEAIRVGEIESSGVFPVTYSVDDEVVLLAEPGWLQRWEPIYPELEPSDSQSLSD